MANVIHAVPSDEVDEFKSIRLHMLSLRVTTSQIAKMCSRLNTLEDAINKFRECFDRIRYFNEILMAGHGEVELSHYTSRETELDEFVWIIISFSTSFVSNCIQRNETNMERHLCFYIEKGSILLRRLRGIQIETFE